MEHNSFISSKHCIKNHSSIVISNQKMLWFAQMDISNSLILELAKNSMELKKLSLWLELPTIWHHKHSPEKDTHILSTYGHSVSFFMNSLLDLCHLEKMLRIPFKFIKKLSKTLLSSQSTWRTKKSMVWFLCSLARTLRVEWEEVSLTLKNMLLLKRFLGYF